MATWHSPDLLDAVTIATNVSPDGQAATLLFRNMEASVDGDHQDAPTLKTQPTNLAVALKDHAEPLRVRIIVRGFVYRTGNGRTTLIIHVAAKTWVIEVKPKKNETDYEHTLLIKLPKTVLFTAALVLIADRDMRTAEDKAHVTIDSIDLEILKKR